MEGAAESRSNPAAVYASSSVQPEGVAFLSLLSACPIVIAVSTTLQVEGTPEESLSDTASVSSGSQKTSDALLRATPFRVYRGHEADVLDLSWSPSNFLVSGSMDRTVRLWHLSLEKSVFAFKHADFVTSVAFHPTNEKLFLSACLDEKLRLWNIPEKTVQSWMDTKMLLMTCQFTKDGAISMYGSNNGIWGLYENPEFR